MSIRSKKLTRTGALIANALIAAKKGQVMKAGNFLVTACDEDETSFDEVSEALCDGIDDAITESGADDVTFVKCGADDDDVTFVDSDTEDDDEDDDEKDNEDKSEGDDEDGEDEKDDTATEEACGLTSSVVRLARRLNSNRY